MNIGIIVYSSHTGHTACVAMRLKARLCAVGHEVVLERIKTAGPAGSDAAIAVSESLPDIGLYDAVVFGCPVKGGLPAPPMDSYLAQLASLDGKKVACLVTGFFPAAWGRDQTVARMIELCKSKGAAVCGCGSVGWFSARRQGQIDQAVDELVRCLEQ